MFKHNHFKQNNNRGSNCVNTCIVKTIWV